MNFKQALSYLLSLGHETLTIKLGLTNTEALLQALGNPHKDFPAVQIAGTNGKGSTAVMLDSICRAAGIRAGLFTSPHLISITERIKFDGQPISEDEFARLTTEVRTAAEKLVKDGALETLPTFFEQVTAIALLAFRETKIDLAILETGLGGRLDSTTAARANVVAITAVAMDHEEYLGHSLEEIATEKAAIIRPGVIVVIAPQPREAFDVIMRQCQGAGVLPRLAGSETDELPVSIHHPTRDARAGTPVRERFCNAGNFNASSDGRCRVTFETPQNVYEGVLLGLRGRHQIDNAAVAVALAEALREKSFAISREAIVRGLEDSKHPGRLELWQGKPKILFDGAHNPAAARALRSYLEECVTQPITMIFGAMRDKRLGEMAAVLFPKADQLILTELDNPRAASIEALKTVVPMDFERSHVHFETSIGEALQTARKFTAAHNLILVTGSLYLVGTAQERVRITEAKISSRR